MRWPWVVRSKDNRTVTIVAPHQTPLGRKSIEAVLLATVIFGLYHFNNLRAAIMPIAKIYLSERPPKELDGIVILLALAVIALGTVIMRYLIFPVVFRKPLIIKMNPEQISVWNIFWFRSYDRERIGVFHLEKHEKVEAEDRENHERAQRRLKPRYIYRDSVQIFMDYNNMPVIITSIYGAMQGRLLLGRIQAIYGETNIRPGGGHSTGKY